MHVLLMFYTVYHSHMEFRNLLQLIVRISISEIDIESSSKSFLIFEDST